MVMLALRNSTALRLPQIGRALGNRDHTTILQGIRKAQNRVDRCPFKKAELQRIEEAEWKCRGVPEYIPRALLRPVFKSARPALGEGR